ncbi:MAG: hypothetical protein IJ064_00785 [Bacteroidaceae bacterium]|nr:hypothetical protein [Bacteroidaceae bacterium]
MNKKNFFFLLLLLLLPVAGHAQDILMTEDGESIQAWDVDASGAQKIYYKTGAEDDAPMKSIEKAKVLLWKKADGTKVRIGVEPQPEAKAATPATKPEPVMLDASDPEANEKCIANFNMTNVYSSKKVSSSAAKEIVGLLHMSPDSKMADKNVEITYSIYKSATYARMAPRTSGIGVNVKNKTDKTIYVYLGNTFFLRHGISTPFTQSSASQTTQAGQAASATGFSQSVVAIPANSTLDLGKQEFFPTDGKNPFGGNIELKQLSSVQGGGLFGIGATTKQWYQFYWTDSKSNMLRKGEVRELQPGESTIDFGFKLTYSFSEDNTQFYHLDTKLYVAKIIGSSFNLWNGSDNIEFNGQPVYFMIPQLQQ